MGASMNKNILFKQNGDTYDMWYIDKDGEHDMGVNFAIPEGTRIEDYPIKIEEFDSSGKRKLRPCQNLKVILANPPKETEVVIFSIDAGIVSTTDTALKIEKELIVRNNNNMELTLPDAFDKSVSVEDSAQHAEIDAMRGIMLNKDVTTLESGEKTTTAKVFLNEDAREGDTVEFKYTDPDDHTQTKTESHLLTSDDIAKGTFDQALDINARSSYDLKVEATLKTADGLESKAYEADNSFYINTNSYTINYDENSTMKGGDSNNDTLVVEGEKVDFSNVANLDSKVESFENIQLKGGSEIKFNAQDVFDITDNLDSVLKIKGDETNKVDVKDKWHEDTSVHADAGFKGYTSNDMIDGHTIHIQIDDKVQTDL